MNLDGEKYGKDYGKLTNQMLFLWSSHSRFI